MKKILNLILIIAVFPLLSIAQEDDKVLKPVKGKYALTNATIVTVANGTITNGSVLINNGKIEAVGANIAIPSDAQSIDCTGHFIYPGMIDAGTGLGLKEVGSVDLTRDDRDVGNIRPHLQALTAVNPNSVAIPVTRVSGITTVLTMPSGGVLPGTAAAINLVGYTPDQMYAGAKVVVMNFPALVRRRWRNESEEDAKKARDKALKNVNDTWDKAEAYVKIQNSPDTRYYPEMAALAKVVKGEMPLMIEVNKAKDVKSAIDWVKKRGYKKVIFSGVSEGWRVAKEIVEADIPVITGPVQATPSRRSDKYDTDYANAGKMHQAGVKVAIRTMNTENSRNLPYHAGFAAAYGMGKEQALKAITIVPAEILGLADQMGSIETGKNASLFVATGDPMETKTKIKHLFINGWKVPMTSRHIRLYDEFLKRSPGLGK